MQASERLRAAGIPFEHSREGGTRKLIIRYAGRTLDFWPTTGQWYDRASKKPRVGVRNLIKELEKCSSRLKAAAARTPPQPCATVT